MRHNLKPWFMPIDGHRGLVYLSGPMTGIEEHNAVAFSQAARDLRESGYAVCSPLDTSEWLGPLSHARYMRFDFARVLEADFVVALDGWQKSPGARAEIFMAVTMGVLVWTYKTQEAVSFEEAQQAIKDA
jgi:hypothetical protein